MHALIRFGGAAMADLPAGMDTDRARGSLWSRLKEERFTNVDLVLVLGALVITALIGALSGVALMS
jgi:hypothetical protein